MRHVSYWRLATWTGTLTVAFLLGCGAKGEKWIDVAVATHDDFQDWTVKQIGESKVLRAELDRRIRELQTLDKDLTRLEAEARVRLELLPRQFGDVEKELQSTQKSRERVKALLAEPGDSLTIGNKQYSRSSAEQMEVTLETEEQTQQERLESLQRSRSRIEKARPVLIARRDSVRKTIIRVKAAREKLDREISEAALSKRYQEAVGGGESSVEEAERQIRQNVDELTVKVRGEIVVADDEINSAASVQEMKDLRAALSG